jgi:GNAT superfamily N-acetyltransferase
MKNIKIVPLTSDRLSQAIELVLSAELDTKEEIEHHLKHLAAHYIALFDNKIIGVIGWYNDDVNYAKDAMGEDFPGKEAYWIGFFAVDEKYRGKGIGFALLKRIEEIVKNKNQKSLWVSSVPETHKYYKRQEFRLVKKGFINGNLKYFMVKSL